MKKSINYSSLTFLLHQQPSERRREREICSISIVLIKTQGERIALTNYHLMYSIYSEQERMKKIRYESKLKGKVKVTVEIKTVQR